MNAREFRITDGSKGIESHGTLNAASRAFWILTAHDLTNGRPPRYTLHGGRVLLWDHVTPPLPPWVVRVLQSPPVLPGGES